MAGKPILKVKLYYSVYIETHRIKERFPATNKRSSAPSGVRLLKSDQTLNCKTFKLSTVCPAQNKSSGGFGTRVACSGSRGAVYPVSKC